MNYITPANRYLIPVHREPSITQPVDAVSDSRDKSRDSLRQQPSNYVFRGEVVDPIVADKQYRPQYNLQIHPQNKDAISLYQSIVSDQRGNGRILDRFV